MDVVRYIVNCTGGTCEPSEFGTNEGTLSADIGEHIINVYPVNRCGVIGAGRSSDIVNVPNGTYVNMCWGVLWQHV